MDKVTLTVNGVEHSVGSEVTSDRSLLQYIRETLGLCGTKYMCREGGCGACSVSVVKELGGPVQSVNSCLVPVLSCQGWSITTIEGIGNRQKGYHVLQKTLAENNGTQCGYCSPGWVVNMYSLMQNEDKPTMLEIEQSLNSNMCRCTGYRPIAQAFKTFGSDASPRTIMDIEEMSICNKGGCCGKKNCDEEPDWCVLSNDEIKNTQIIEINLKDNKTWYKVYDLSSVFEVLNKNGYDSYMMISGNTAQGVEPIFEYPDCLIDITSVKELKSHSIDQNLTLGAGNSITEFLDCCKSVAKQEDFKYLLKFVEHIELVASIPIKNLGSVGGNLMIKNRKNAFPSDLFILLETVGAIVIIVTSGGVTKKLSMMDFLKEDMKGKVLVGIILPPLGKQYLFETFKVMPRSQSAHAMVNAGFLYELSSDNTVISARIVFGGLSEEFIRAEATEKYFEGKPLFQNSTLQGALNILEGEMVVKEELGGHSVAYRKQLAMSLLYKGLLSLCPKDSLKPKYVSGTTKIHHTRPVSSATQIYDTDPTLYPLNQPIPKVEALIQCAGETKYTNDLPTQPGEVHAAFALSTVAVGDIVQIDASQALKLPGVIAFYTAADIPGLNSYTPAGESVFRGHEEVLASTKVQYYNQPIGVVIAETHQIAIRAATMVTATYKNVKQPITDVKVAITDSTKLTLMGSHTPTEKGRDVAMTIKGQETIYGQCHYTMEGISCISLPTEEGMELHVTTQWMDNCHQMVSKALNMDSSKIDVHCRRLGGAFGIKLTRPNQTAIACSLATLKLNRPCRMEIPLSTSTRAIGKRLPCHSEYEVEVSSTGVIQSINLKTYEDNGYMLDEALTMLGVEMFNNCYNPARWNYEVYDTVTDTAKNTWCRAPGSLEAISMAESIMNRISDELGIDCLEVRKANVDTANCNDIIAMIDELKQTASYEERKANIEKFNRENEWRKRAFKCATVNWIPAANSVFDVNLTVYHGDGSVIITHGGVEMGQGLNTKAIQVCAYLLQIPMDKIQIKGNNTIFAPNCFATGGSIGSQNVCLGVKRCCEALLQRLAPARAQLSNPTWLELILKAYTLDVDLQVHSYVGAADINNIHALGASLCEVEVDILTGEWELRRVDILQDAGQSVSPEIDVGQVEGAFIMGLGYWTTEELVYNKTSGELLTDRTWNYYPPLINDTPQIFNVTLKKKSYSVDCLFGAKVTGEPPICLAIAVGFAIRAAVAEFRKSKGLPGWFDHEGPYTVEKISLAAAVSKEDFLLS